MLFKCIVTLTELSSMCACTVQNKPAGFCDMKFVNDADLSVYRVGELRSERRLFCRSYGDMSKTSRQAILHGDRNSTESWANLN